MEAGLRTLNGDRLKLLELSNGGILSMHSDKSVTGESRVFNENLINYMSIDQMQGTGGIIQLGIKQAR